MSLVAINCENIGYANLNYGGDFIRKILNDEQGNYFLVIRHIISALRCVEYNPDLFCDLIVPSYITNPDVYNQETPHTVSVICQKLTNVPKAVSIIVTPIQDMFFDLDNYETIFEHELHKYFVLAEKQIVAMKIDEIDYTFEITNCVADNDTKCDNGDKKITVVHLEDRDFVINFMQ